ncbi:MAG: DUF2384 domain-containing protein [Burkholderiaceae bacterium]
MAISKPLDLMDCLQDEPPSYLAVSQSSPLDRIKLVKAGLPAGVVVTLATSMGVPRDQLLRWIGIPRATANRKIKAGERLNQDESERVLGLIKLIGQVERIVAESGDPTGFLSARWTAQWLALPLPALGGRLPGDFMDTFEGRSLVSGLMAQIQSGAYA